VPKTSDPDPEPEVPESAALGRLNLDLTTDAKLNPHCNIDNAVRILAHHPQWRDALYYDSFSHRVMWNDNGRVKQWDDAADLRLTVWMQRALGLPSMLDIVVHKAVSARAHECQRNPLTGWLNGLTWDGEDRLCHLMPDGFGSVRNAYTEAVGRCFAVSLVARAFEPGCKADNMIVLEGPQGGGKTTALEILGGEWYSEMHEAITGKDFLQNLEGKWLVEISEMHSFSRADVKRVKGIISGRNDYYRASYGRRSQDHPRGCIFAGTTNRDDWNEDETGARRFFPVNCIEINIDWIRSNRDQLFAEAVARFRRGESWSDIPLLDARSEQEARRNVDEWESVIRRYVAESPHTDPGGAVTWYPRDAPLRETSVGDVLREALQIPEGKWNRADQMRVASALRLAGFVRVSRAGKKMWANRADRILEQQDLAI
jgi:putative DNA primase/helicase